MTKKRAYISVFNKTDVVDFAKELTKLGYETVSTGGTYKLLKENGLNVIDVSEITGFQEMLKGKVKSLHPNVFSGILADTTNTNEAEEIKNAKIEPFELVCVNLYPFEKYTDKDVDIQTLVENIDIGGVALLRAAAKNFKCVGVVCDIDDYKKVIEELKTGNLSSQTRENLAVKAFWTTAKYDGIITEEFSKQFKIDDYKNLALKKIQELRYGENPHQEAGLYEPENGQKLDYEILNGKELSYNNILDISSSLAIVSEFYDTKAVAIVKHTVPCGVAIGNSLEEAYLKAFDADSISAFGGIIAFTDTVDEKIAKHANSVFLEVVVAPDFTPKALEILKSKKNIRIIKLNTPLKDYKNYLNREIKITPFGVLVQNADKKELEPSTFKVVTKLKPTEQQVADMVFANKIVKHVKSNGIVIAKDLKTLGICGGQTNRVSAIEIALSRCLDCAKDAVLASDGFFPMPDNVEAAAAERVSAIIQPGGSIKDNENIKLADKYGLVMIMTGIRHFKH